MGTAFYSAQVLESGTFSSFDPESEPNSGHVLSLRLRRRDVNIAL